MFQNYFIVNGQRYYTGTIFVINNMGEQVEASFMCYDTEHLVYVYKMRNKTWRSGPKYFWKNFVCVTDKKDTKAKTPVVKTKRDRDINGMTLGWLWYIFLMVISVIFKDAIWLWILFSVVFFNWRAKKIEEEGTYIEW